MSSKWPVTRLETLCERITVGWVGPMVDEYVEDGIPFLRSQNILPFSISTSNLKYIPSEFHRRIIKSALRPGDVAVVRTGYPGTAAVVPRWLGEGNCADLVVITPGAKLDAAFLCATFNSTWGMAAVGGRLVGSAQQHFNIGAAKRMEIHVPPLPAQRKISAILSAYGDLIENNKRRIKILEEMAQRIYREWFVDFRYPGHENVPLVESELGPIPEQWKWRTAAEALTVNPRISPLDRSAMRPFIPMASLSESGMHVGAVELRAGASGPKFENGDTLFARITPCLENGKTAFVQCLSPGESGSGSTEFIVLRSSLLSPELTYLLAKDESFRSHAIKSMSGATGRQRVREECFRSFMLAVPPPGIIEQFSGIAKPAFGLSYQLFKANESLRTTRDLLLPRLISGEIDVDNLDIALPDVAA